jgi:hypothetical protein
MSKRNPIQFVVQNIAYVLLLAGLGMVYIFNAHSSERKLREIQSLKIERQNVHDEYMQLKQEVLHKSTASELDKILGVKGLGRQPVAPVIIDDNEG